MIIAKLGDFELRLKDYIGDHKYMTHDIDIVKRTDSESVFTIASFNEDSELVSCGDRLLSQIEDAYDLECVNKLAKIGGAIIRTENEFSGYGEMRTIKTWSMGHSVYGEPNVVRHYPIENNLKIYEACAEIDCNSKYYWNEEDAIDYIMDSYEDCVRRGYVEDRNRDEVREILKASGEIKDVGAYWIIEVK